MKGLFNGVCNICGRFRPHCANVFEKKGTARFYAIERRLTVCQECRKATENKGKFRLSEEHK